MCCESGWRLPLRADGGELPCVALLPAVVYMSSVQPEDLKHVILTEFHESARIDRQLFGRSARQGDPGSFECLVSLEDELFERFIPAVARRFVSVCLQRHASSASRLGKWLRRFAQWRAERLHAKIRRDTVEHDKRLEKALAFAGQAE